MEVDWWIGDGVEVEWSEGKMEDPLEVELWWSEGEVELEVTWSGGGVEL